MRSDRRLEIRLSENEFDQIQKNAEICGKTVSAYLRDVGCNMCTLNFDYSAIKNHTDTIISLQNAILHLVFTINRSQQYVPPDLEYILEQITSITNLQKEILSSCRVLIQSSEKQIRNTVNRIVNLKTKNCDSRRTK